MHRLTRLLAAGLCVAAAASAAQAQVRRLQPAPNAAPSASARAAQSVPNPAGLRPIFPAGITAGSGAAVSTDPVAATTAPLATTDSAGLTAGTGAAGGVTAGGGQVTAPELVSPDSAAAATTVLGAGGTVRGPGQAAGGAGGFSATDAARSFFFADANKDGDITRAEFNRLSIRSQPFEEMDRNFDGVISRFEYEDSLR